MQGGSHTGRGGESGGDMKRDRRHVRVGRRERRLAVPNTAAGIRGHLEEGIVERIAVALLESDAGAVSEDICLSEQKGAASFSFQKFKALVGESRMRCTVLPEACTTIFPLSACASSRTLFGPRYSVKPAK